MKSANRSEPDLSSDSRNRVIASIYETVLKPELYDDFMQAWSEHVQAAVAELGGLRDAASEALALEDPELEQHFLRGFDILEQIGRQRSAADPLVTVADSARFALALSPDGRVLACSATAQYQIGSGAGRADLDGRLTADSRRNLARLMSEAKGGNTQPAPCVLVSDTASGHMIARCQPLPDGAAAIFIDAIDLNWSLPVETLLVDSFGLTPAEIEVIHNLVSGQALKDIARMTNRSEHTVRNQLKSALAKTGARSQVELVRLVAFLARDRAVANAPETATFPSADTDLRHWLITPDGRGFEVFEFGLPTGRPVLFLHGMLDCVAALRISAARFAARGWRVLAPVRAGFGHSEPLTNATAAINASTHQIAQVMDHFGATRAPIIGHMAGAAYAHAAARALPDRVQGILGISGGVPIRSLRQISAMAPRQQLVAFTARFARPILPAILRAGIAQIDSKDVESFISALYPPGTVDHELIRDRSLVAPMMAAFRHSVLQGHHGFFSDSLVLTSNWSNHLAPTSCPVIHLHGRHDPVVSIDSVEDLATACPNIRLERDDTGGQLQLYRSPDRVLATLDRLTSGAFDGVNARKSA
jgi:pimeloyl-ACP methyl ester carboxylesterase